MLPIERRRQLPGFGDALALVYPAVARLVGMDAFHRLARQFLRHPVRRSGFGADFAEFLSEMRPLRAAPYLPDLARLEWARYRVQQAPLGTPPAISRPVVAGEADWPWLRFHLHPATALVASVFPLLRIWLQNCQGSPAPVDAGSEPGVQLLVTRRGQEIEMRPLTVGDYSLLSELAGGRSLEHARRQAERADVGFDLADALSRYFGEGVIAGFGLILPRATRRPAAARTPPSPPSPAAAAAAGPATARSR